MITLDETQRVNVKLVAKKANGVAGKVPSVPTVKSSNPAVCSASLAADGSIEIDGKGPGTATVTVEGAPPHKYEINLPVTVTEAPIVTIETDAAAPVAQPQFAPK